jgi:hypothetical protein
LCQLRFLWLVSQAVSRRFLWLLPVGMSAVVFAPIIRNYFFSDDFFNFWYLTNEGVGHFMLRMHGGHSCVTRNLAMALLYSLFGLSPAPYFTLALLTHLLNVFLLYEVVRQLTASPRIACLAAALWGIAPVHQGTLGWVAAYGQVLAGTCALWVLVGLARRRTGQPGRTSTRWLWGAAMIVGALSFGVGIGVALVMPAIAWLLLPPGRQRASTVALFAAAAVAVVALYVGQQRLYAALYDEVPAPGSLGALANWRAQIGFVADLAGYGVVALVLGALERPPHYPGLVGGMVISAAMLLTGIAIGSAPQRTARPLLACALLAAGVYGLIAAGRGALVADTNLAAMVRTARYQYVGAIAAAVALGMVANVLGTGWRMPEWVKDGALASWAAATLALTLWVGPPVNHFNAARNEAAKVVGTVDAMVSAAPPGSDVYIANRPFGSVGLMYGADLAAFPGWAAIFAIFHPDDVVDGHRLHFVIEDVGILARAQEGRRASALLCGPPGATPDAAAPGEH